MNLGPFELILILLAVIGIWRAFSRRPEPKADAGQSRQGSSSMMPAIIVIAILVLIVLLIDNSHQNGNQVTFPQIPVTIAIGQRAPFRPNHLIGFPNTCRIDDGTHSTSWRPRADGLCYPDDQFR